MIESFSSYTTFISSQVIFYCHSTIQTEECKSCANKMLLIFLTLSCFYFSVILSLTARKRITICAPGETLSISLKGIKMENATLCFYRNGPVVTLVKSGEPVASRHPKYINRLNVSSKNINVLNVNMSDMGIYILIDPKNRTVSNTTMIVMGKNCIQFKML